MKVKISRQAVKEFEGAYWNAFNDVLAMSEPEGMEGLLLDCHYIYWYATEMCNGGHEHYFENRQGTDFEEVQKALFSLDCEKHSAILGQAHDIMPRLLSEKTPDPELEKLDEKIHDLDLAFFELEPNLFDVLVVIQKEHEDELVEWV